MDLNGKLLIIEGPDGVGKSTLSQALARALTSHGLPVVYRAFPGHEVGSLGQLVYELHHDSRKYGVERVDAASLQTMHIAAHIELLNREIIPALRSGSLVILDRYWWSTWVYGRAANVSATFLDYIIRAELESWSGIWPTICFLITRETPLRNEHPTAMWRKLKQLYEELSDREAKRYPVRLVHNDLPIIETVAELLHAIDPLLHERKPMRMVGSDDEHRLPSGSLLTKDCADGLTSEISSSRPESLVSFSRLSPAIPTHVLDTFWRFATERQAIFFRRFRNEPTPWTQDPILARHKFTNAYRASDRISQYLIRQVIYHGDQNPEETFFRTILFKIFNRIDTWELLQRAVGTITFADYSYEEYDQTLTAALESGHRIFSPAYIMPTGAGLTGERRKHRNFLRLIEVMMRDEVPVRIFEMRHMRDAFELLRSYPMIGDFLAFQYVTDLNYGSLADWSEMEFVVAGPGAQSGLRKCFSSLGGLSEADAIRLVSDQQEAHLERLHLSFNTLWGRRLQLIDCQNLFCEVDKYARVAHPEVQGSGGRTRIKQLYHPTQAPLDYWYPPKWGVNERMKETI